MASWRHSAIRPEIAGKTLVTNVAERSDTHKGYITSHMPDRTRGLRKSGLHTLRLGAHGPSIWNEGWTGTRIGAGGEEMGGRRGVLLVVTSLGVGHEMCHGEPRPSIKE